MSAAVPQLRRLLATETKKHLIFAIGCSIVATVIGRFTYRQTRLDNYRKFHTTYDAKADYQRMKAAGVFRAFDTE